MLNALLVVIGLVCGWTGNVVAQSNEPNLAAATVSVAGSPAAPTVADSKPAANCKCDGKAKCNKSCTCAKAKAACKCSADCKCGTNCKCDGKAKCNKSCTCAKGKHHHRHKCSGCGTGR